MLDFTRRAFREFFQIWLWLNLIICTVGGGVVFYYLTRTQSTDVWGRAIRGEYESNGGLVFLGILLGLIFGFIFNILLGGIVSTFLNIDVNIEYNKKTLSDIYNKINIFDNKNKIETSSILNISEQKIPNNPTPINKKIDDDYYHFDENGKKDSEKWLCSKCSNINNMTDINCKKCGKERGQLIT